MLALRLTLPDIEWLLRVVINNDPRKPIETGELHHKTIKILDFLREGLARFLPKAPPPAPMERGYERTPIPSQLSEQSADVDLLRTVQEPDEYLNQVVQADEHYGPLLKWKMLCSQGFYLFAAAAVRQSELEMGPSEKLAKLGLAEQFLKVDQFLHPFSVDSHLLQASADFYKLRI